MGLEISDQEALDLFIKLVALTRSIYRPMPFHDEEAEEIKFQIKNE